MLRVTTLHASSAAATASYYATYLTKAPGEVPGLWSGRQAVGLALHGPIDADSLESLLSGCDPTTGSLLGRELVDRTTSEGRVVKAVSGFDATFSAPKSLSTLWALTGDEGLLEAHDVAVSTALKHLEQFGSTTRMRFDGRRLHPDSQGLTMGTFRQTTSRADDPQIHTHAVISAKVQTADGRWLALDARYLKRHQRAIGGLYQSVLRSELTNRFGVGWGPIANGQAEIVGVPTELTAVFSKRTAAIDHALDPKLDEFRQREGRDPSRWERAAMTREAAVDTRSHKSGNGAPDLMTRWRTEAAASGWDGASLTKSIADAARNMEPPTTRPVTVEEIISRVSAQHSSWGRADLLQAICDTQPPASATSGHRWHRALERAVDQIIDRCVDLDPTNVASRRTSDGRSVWIEPTATRFTSETILAQEEHIIMWAIAAQHPQPEPSDTVKQDGLDPLQAAAAAAVAGRDRLVLIVGPAGAGKTRMLAAATSDLDHHHRAVFGVAPTAKAARVLERDTGMPTDTVAKLLHEWQRTDRPPLPELQLERGATLVVDEAGMLATPALHQLVALAEQHDWRLVLVGDPRQLQAVGRGGMLGELCGNGRVDQLEQLHRFTNAWEATASLQLRRGDTKALDAYASHGRIVAGPLDDHLRAIADTWIAHHQRSETIALVASSNDHVDLINATVQQARVDHGELARNTGVPIAGGEHAHVGDVIATRRNDRRLLTTAGEPVRNRETWTVHTVQPDGGLTVTRNDGHGTVTLPADYVHEHVRLGYAATEHGYQSETVTTAVALASAATTRRGLYVAATRGRELNQIRVITDSTDPAEARDVLDAVLAIDRADQPAVSQRRELAATQPAVSKPPLQPRCRIPAWFDAHLANARLQLARAVELDRRQQDVRHPLVRSLAVREHELTEITAATSADRHALDHATNNLTAAEQRRDHVKQQFQQAPRLARRELRHGFLVAQQALETAEQHLDQARFRTSPAVHQHAAALQRRDEAVVELRRHDLRAKQAGPITSSHQHRIRVEALEHWREWAAGHPINNHDLGRTIYILGYRTDDRPLARTLAPHVHTQRSHAYSERGRGLGREL